VDTLFTELFSFLQCRVVVVGLSVGEEHKKISVVAAGSVLRCKHDVAKEGEGSSCVGCSSDKMR
jgi:hypothetical protein